MTLYRRRYCSQRAVCRDGERLRDAVRLGRRPCLLAIVYTRLTAGMEYR